MYTFAVTLLLGLALFKIVDLLEDFVPDVTKLHSAVTAALAVAGVWALDWSLFEGFAIGVREAWMGILMTGLVVAGTTSVWRALFHWLGSSEGEEPAVRHRHPGPMTRAA